MVGSLEFIGCFRRGGLAEWWACGSSVGVLFEISIVCLFFVPWSVCGVVGSCVVAAALFVVVVVWGLVALWVGCSCFLVCFCFSGCGLLLRVSWLVVGVCVVVACGWFVLFLVFLESLILAQDERWRRA